MITQIGDQLNVLALCSGAVCNLAFQGTVINDAKKPDTEAQAGFTACETAPGSPYQETGRAARVAVSDNRDGQFDADVDLPAARFNTQRRGR